MPLPGPSGRRSYVLVVALFVALATGAAASLLIGAATESGGPPPRASELVLPSGLFSWLLIGVLGIVAVVFAYQRLSGVTVRLPNRAVVTFLVVILIAVLFVVAFRVAVVGGPSPTGEVSVGQNSTGTHPPNQTATNLTSGGNVTPFLLPGLPGWVPWVVIAGLLLIVTVAVFPTLLEYAADRRARAVPPPPPADARAVRTALREAAEALDRGGDPRSVIVRLYGELLARLAPVVGDVNPETPEEIRARHLQPLGIRAESATALTRLFEEARYSTHPLAEAAADRARSAVREALSDLDRAAESA
jgi:hypothetical protein